MFVHGRLMLPDYFAVAILAGNLCFLVLTTVYAMQTLLSKRSLSASINYSARLMQKLLDLKIFI